MRIAPYAFALLAVGCDQTLPKESHVKVTQGPNTPPYVYCLTVDDPQRKLHSRYCDFTVNDKELDEIYMEEEVGGKMFYATFKLGDVNSSIVRERDGRPHTVAILKRNSKEAQNFIANYEYYKNSLPKN